MLASDDWMQPANNKKDTIKYLNIYITLFIMFIENVKVQAFAAQNRPTVITSS